MSPPFGKLSVLIIQTCLAVFCVSRASAAEQGAVTVQKRFQLCPRGSTLTGQQALTAVDARSAVECAVSCATTSGCGSYNFCPDDPSVATGCQLLADRNSPSCADLTSLSGSSCLHGYKDVSTTPAGVVCQNGGTPRATDTGQCDCPLPYAGDTCERYIRDCMEAFDNGFNNNSFSGVYWIQPLTAPAPFLVPCSLQQGATLVLRRSAGSQWTLNQDYGTCISGFGEGLAASATTVPDSFFIGLDNLHYLLFQAEYESQMLMVWSSGEIEGTVIFQDFNVDSVSNRYLIFYREVILDNSNGASPGFYQGMEFFAHGMIDTYGCAYGNEAPGWYTSECMGPRVFSDQILWNINGVDQALDYFDFTVVRKSPFYDSSAG